MHLHAKLIRRIGLLGTSITIKHNLFAKADHAIEFVTPTTILQKNIDRVLHQFVSNGNSKQLQNTLRSAQQMFRQKNVQDVLVACTDFHGMVNEISNITIHDTLSILIRATVKNIVGTHIKL
jgi:aspartate/glutamate racemase